MKNKNIKPNEVVPAKVAIECYEKAIEIIKSKRLAFGIKDFSTCVLLPCILWDLNDAKSPSPCGQDWNWEDVGNMFVEWRHSKTDYIYEQNNKAKKNELRIELLMEAIEEAKERAIEEQPMSSSINCTICGCSATMIDHLPLVPTDKPNYGFDNELYATFKCNECGYIFAQTLEIRVKQSNEESTLKSELEELRAEFEQYKKESIKWSVEDFIGIAEEKDLTITRETAQLALEEMIDHHDCELGITWDSVKYYLAKYTQD